MRASRIRTHRGLARALVTGLATGALAAGILQAAQPAAAAKVCDGVTVDCAIGDTGPGGGIVFYDAGSRKPWGRYLEAAPAGWFGGSQDPSRAWCPSGARGFTMYVKTKHAIGSGGENSTRIVRACGRKAAAGLAVSYRGGGKSDWFLPSKDELKALHAQQAAVGGFSDEFNVWSSSQYREKGMDTRSVAWGQSFIPSGGAGGAGKQTGGWVRPIRAF